MCCTPAVCNLSTLMLFFYRLAKAVGLWLNIEHKWAVNVCLQEQSQSQSAMILAKSLMCSTSPVLWVFNTLKDHIVLQAIRSSDCYSSDMQTADLIYVYDYCYYIWWLATVHSRGDVGERIGDEEDTPGDYLMEVRSLLYTQLCITCMLKLNQRICWDLDLKIYLHRQGMSLETTWERWSVLYDQKRRWEVGWDSYTVHPSELKIFFPGLNVNSSSNIYHMRRQLNFWKSACLPQHRQHPTADTLHLVCQTVSKNEMCSTKHRTTT